MERRQAELTHAALLRSNALLSGGSHDGDTPFACGLREPKGCGSEGGDAPSGQTNGLEAVAPWISGRCRGVAPKPRVCLFEAELSVRLPSRGVLLRDG